MRRLLLDLVEPRQECVHLGERRRDEHPHFLAGGPQSFGESKAAAEGVPVRVLVAEDEDLIVGVDELLYLVEDV